MNSNSFLIGENCSSMTNKWLLENTKFKINITFVIIEPTGNNPGKIFCEYYNHSLQPSYYDLKDFCGTNHVINYCFSSNFSNSADNLWGERASFIMLSKGCAAANGHIADYLFDDMIMRELSTFITAEIKPYSIEDVLKFGSMDKKKYMSVHQTCENKIIYVIDNVIYSGIFPIEWALNPETFDWEYDGKMEHFIMGPGTSPDHCGNCNYYGSLRGVFIGYCTNCAKRYRYTRGNGFSDRGIEYKGEDGDEDAILYMQKATYLSGIDITNLGYHNDTNEQYMNCLSGGAVPVGFDVCDDQENMDPVREYEIDDCSLPVVNDKVWESKKYPRRAYSFPSWDCSNTGIINTYQTDELTPDFIRNKLDTFFLINKNVLEITDNNYSFPIGERPKWDHYRITKRPYSWYAWNAILKSAQYGNSEIEIRLYLSNVHSVECPAKIVLDCNLVSGRIPIYKPTFKLLKAWIMDEIGADKIVIPETNPAACSLLSPMMPVY